MGHANVHEASNTCLINPAFCIHITTAAPWSIPADLKLKEMPCIDACTAAPWGIPTESHVLLRMSDAGASCRVLQRPYGRVDRPKLKKQLLARCLRHGVSPPLPPQISPSGATWGFDVSLLASFPVLLCQATAADSNFPACQACITAGLLMLYCTRPLLVAWPIR